MEASCLPSSLSAVAEQQPLGLPPARVPASRALWTMKSREQTPFLAPFPLLRGWRGWGGGTQQPQGVLDSPGDGFFSIFHLSVCSPGSRGPRCPCPPGLTCQFPSHLPSLGSCKGFWTSAGYVAPAPAARLLANSDYFSFSVLSWVPLFLTVHFLWTQD